MTGQFTKKFVKGEAAMVTEAHLNGGYPYYHFQVVNANETQVTLKAGKESFTKPIMRSHGQEFTIISMSGPYERMIGKPSKFKVYPFREKK